MKRIIPALVALAMLVAACGDDDSGGDDALVADLRQQILEGTPDDADIPLSDEDAACFASGLIDSFGAERMAGALQMEFEEFMQDATESERLAVVDTMLDCIDFGAVMADQFGEGLSSDSAECLGDAFATSEGFRTAIAASFGGSSTDPFDDPALLEEMLPAMLECLTAEELIQLGEG